MAQNDIDYFLLHTLLKHALALGLLSCQLFWCLHLFAARFLSIYLDTKLLGHGWILEHQFVIQLLQEDIHVHLSQLLLRLVHVNEPAHSLADYRHCGSVHILRLHGVFHVELVLG